VLPSGSTPFDGPDSFQSKQSASYNKETSDNDGKHGTGSNHGSGLQMPVQALSTLGNDEQLLLTSHLYCAHTNLHCPAEYKQSMKRERDNARYE
jgi:hypothetical protein